MALDGLSYDPDDKPVAGSLIDELERERAKLERMSTILETQFAKFANQMKTELANYNGTADGTTETEIKIIVASGNGAPIAFLDVDGVTVNLSGSAVLVETNPVQFVRLVDEDTGDMTYEATINVTDAVTESATVTLVDSEGTGLNLNGASINFV